MSDEPQSTPQPPSASSASPIGSAVATVESSHGQVTAQIDQRPEVVVGAAFGGGLLLALILKRLAR